MQNNILKFLGFILYLLRKLKYNDYEYDKSRNYQEQY